MRRRVVRRGRGDCVGGVESADASVAGADGSVFISVLVLVFISVFILLSVLVEGLSDWIEHKVWFSVVELRRMRMV